MKATVQNILIENYEEYEKTHAIPLHARKAAESIIKCRTSALGGHVQICPEGHVYRIWYNSCKHRACRQCAGIQIEDWINKQKETILNTEHYHVIFTIPHDLNELWLLNQKEMTNILFSCAKESLFGMFGNEDFVGAEPGMIATLQTWGETLILHPHIHALVIGGGLTEEGKWKKVKKGYVVPVKELMKIFRAKVLDKLHNLTYDGNINSSKGTRYHQTQKLLRKQGKKKWNVHICKRYAYGDGVVTYLGRYIKGGAISNSRLISIEDNKVVFKYEDNKDNKKEKTMVLNAEEFIRRFLLHVPKKGTKVVRYYGLYSSSKRKELEICRRLMGQAPIKEHKRITWQEYCELKGNSHPELCPVCGAILVRGEEFKTQRELKRIVLRLPRARPEKERDIIGNQIA